MQLTVFAMERQKKKRREKEEKEKEKREPRKAFHPSVFA